MLTRNVWSTGATAINSLKTALQALLLGLIFVLLPPTTYAYKTENAKSGHDHLVSRALKLFQKHYIFEELNETISKDYDQLYRDLHPWDLGIFGGCTSATFKHRTLKKDKDKYTYGRLIISGARNEDEIDVVYENFDHLGIPTHIQNLCGVRTTFTHFWVADEGPEKKVRGLSTAATCEKAAGKYPNAWMKIATGAGTNAVHSSAPPLWDQAIHAYRSGNKERAYERLGHVAHLLQDQTLGAHAHGDFHGATHGAGVLDAYEEWTANMDLEEWLQLADWNNLNELVDLPSNSQIFNSLSPSWREGIPRDKNKRKLFYLVYTANQYADFFPSWRKNSDTLVGVIPSYKGEKQCDGNTEVLSFSDGTPDGTTPWVDYNDGTWPKDLLKGEYGKVHINVFNKSPPRHVEYHARKSYVYAIRATASLIKLFLETVGAEITPRPPSCEVDVSPPEITAPDDVTVEQTSPSGTAVDLGSPIVVDNCDTDPVVDNDAPAVFPQGSTVVTWWATDSSGNISSMAVQLVTVEDTTDPVVTAALVPTADKGVFEVEFSCVDVADPSATATGEINGTFVADGQMVKLTIKKQTRVWQHDGLLEIRAPTFSLVATCIDFSGNVGAATATPVMDGPIARWWRKRHSTGRTRN